MHHRVGQTPATEWPLGWWCDRFDIGGVARLQAAHEGILADLTLGQEFFRGAAPIAPDIAER